MHTRTAAASIPHTPATQWLKSRQVTFTVHAYNYVPHGGARESARQLGVNEHCVIKTLIMQNEKNSPLIVLMHGDCTISTKNLARQIGAKSVQPCTPEVAQRHSGYLVGGTSPFGTRRTIPIYIEQSILSLPEIYINAGRRGLLLRLSPTLCAEILHATPVQCALPGK